MAFGDPDAESSADANAADMGEAEGNPHGGFGDSASDDESSADDSIGRTGNESDLEGPDYSGWDDAQSAQTQSERDHANEFSGLRSFSAPAPPAISTSNVPARTARDIDPRSTTPAVGFGPTQAQKDAGFRGFSIAEEVQKDWDAMKARHAKTMTKDFGPFSYKDSVVSKHEKEKDVQAFMDKHGKNLQAMSTRHSQLQAHRNSATPKGDDSIMGFSKSTIGRALMGLVSPLGGIAMGLLQNFDQYDPHPIETELEQMQKDLGMIQPEQDEMEVPIYRQRTLCNLKPGMQWNEGTGTCIASSSDEANPIDTNAAA
jgi:hypothetical protein